MLATMLVNERRPCIAACGGSCHVNAVDVSDIRSHQITRIQRTHGFAPRLPAKAVAHITSTSRAWVKRLEGSATLGGWTGLVPEDKPLRASHTPRSLASTGHATHEPMNMASNQRAGGFDKWREGRKLSWRFCRSVDPRALFLLIFPKLHRA